MNLIRIRMQYLTRLFDRCSLLYIDNRAMPSRYDQHILTLNDLVTIITKDRHVPGTLIERRTSLDTANIPWSTAYEQY